MLRVSVLDLAGAGRHAVQLADDPLLHVGRQAGQRTAGDTGLGAELFPVSRELDDRPEADFGMVPPDVQAPQVPAALVILQVLIGDRDVLARGRRAAGHREHVHGRLGKQRAKFTTSAAGDVRLQVLVAVYADLPAKILAIANPAEAV